MSHSNPGQPIELSCPLPRSPDTRIYIRISRLEKALLIALTTNAVDNQSNVAAMGSFVYALPDRFNPQQPLATTLFSSESTVEFTTRLARTLARRLNMPTYVNNSVSFADSGLGGTIEEEMEGFKNVLDIVCDSLKNV